MCVVKIDFTNTFKIKPIEATIIIISYDELKQLFNLLIVDPKCKLNLN